MIEEQRNREEVPFWFDPLCPWAWVTSRWLLQVEQVRPVRADWRLMSLADLNLVQRKGEGLSEQYRDLMERAWGPVRVCAAAAEHAGRGILGRLYTAIGTRCHNHRRRDDPTVIAEALAEVGLPDVLSAAADSEEFDQLIRDSHDEAFNEVGLDVGTPVLRIGSTAMFGPVIRRAPRGEAAGRLWDGLVLVAGTEGFFELKRSRDRSVKPYFD
ncbi:putative DsbA family dithiol-disulfide isomerase [Nonomuraea fuscirosea]|uniref:Putative DsbA family dithiol-disulfide isomerase n=1 Tax=Nonomuraea fuscirosea TaxID=1291556 RepID=A0A2T0LXS0_9ACTN|nr:DsbA family protein [Nonomuraea fuscirosea]PRX48911.1 putative DsbA family dithiol-disulfide isomerase [Nonomuraea fuscirosea]